MRILTPNKISIKVANTIIVHHPELNKKKDEIRYGLEWIISGLFQVVLTIIAAIPLGVALEAIVILISGAVLRMFSGGAHARGYFRCLFLSLIQIIGISLVVKYTTVLDEYTYFCLFLLFISIIIIFIKAPVLHKKKDMFTDKEKRKLKYLSLFTFGTLYAFSYLPYLSEFQYCIWLSLILQSFTLTFVWEKILSYGENFIYK
ncbi:accessory gene regulator ArgB-like protein [Rossellomorea arthrocnemi]|jgi:accessory gene regulator B|uniref:accessory gene regulator ArgB-like protein n=1 Tax=Rossellomorea arthrocnemi TaxID=2769542 RepID=UPI0019191F60|nr:accessory gene regulator B family protein [Rossellomorea arthrocnemi]